MRQSTGVSMRHASALLPEHVAIAEEVSLLELFELLSLELPLHELVCESVI